MSQGEIGGDPAAVRDWARTLEGWGVDEIEAFDHVLGADPSHWSDGPPPGYDRIPYTTADPFHEPLLLFAHLAAVTTRLRFATSVLILPQRQTALVAKQCAELDLLSGGRFALGVGVGWNHVEYACLGEDFATRGQRADEQIGVLRALWSEPVVSYRGRWDAIDRAGLNPLPDARRIPIWIGGHSAAAIRRAGRLGDGWVLNQTPETVVRTRMLERLDEQLAAHGRTRADVEISGWVRLHGRDLEQWRDEAERWRALGVDRIGLVTRGEGPGPEPHLALVERYLERVA
jgi:probable F420-dependent oxidoreductase